MLEMVRGLAEDVAKVAASPLWSLSDSDLTDTLHEANQLERAAATLRARLVQEATSRGAPAREHHRTTAAWLRDRLRLDYRPARELAAHADLIKRHPHLEQALINNIIDLPQATVIADTLDSLREALAGLPDTGDRTAEQLAEQALAMLLEMAGRFPAYQLRRLGERILEHIAPEIAEKADEAALRRQEARARKNRFFTLSRPVNGQVRVTGSLSAEDAAIVSAALHPLCKPSPGDTRTPGQKRADALIDICRLALRSTELPANGGDPAQVNVTVPFDPLTSSLGTGVTDNGERFSAETARRVACDALILPVVLGGQGEVLDVGRSRRVVGGPLHRAVNIRDRGCAFSDCDRPPRWCDVHHIRHWADGGTTCLDNLVLLCRRHHRILHDAGSGWQVRLADDRLPEFIPPKWIDPDQIPRRNLYHPRT